MKGLSFLFGLLVVFFAWFAFAPSTAEGQTYLPHIGRIIAPTTPTVELTAAVAPTNTITPTATATRTPTITPTPSITPTPTNSPTITLTPTKTGTPTTTPTVTPTPTDTIGDGVIVLNSHHDYRSNDGRVTVVGEVRNDTQSNATNIKVTVTLYNNRTDVVDSVDLYVWRDVLKPGDKTCFEAIFLGYPAYNRYGFETAYINTSADPRPLEIYGDGALYLQEQSAWHLFGQIRNTQPTVEGQTVEPLAYPQIIGTLYHEMGHVLDCMYINALAETLAPGESSIWQMTLRPLSQAEMKDYRVQAR